jgi:hypothetical protein
LRTSTSRLVLENPGPILPVRHERDIFLSRRSSHGDLIHCVGVVTDHCVGAVTRSDTPLEATADVCRRSAGIRAAALETTCCTPQMSGPACPTAAGRQPKRKWRPYRPNRRLQERTGMRPRQTSQVPKARAGSSRKRLNTSSADRARHFRRSHAASHTLCSRNAIRWRSYPSQQLVTPREK